MLSYIFKKKKREKKHIEEKKIVGKVKGNNSFFLTGLIVKKQKNKNKFLMEDLSRRSVAKLFSFHPAKATEKRKKIENQVITYLYRNWEKVTHFKN